MTAAQVIELNTRGGAMTKTDRAAADRILAAACAEVVRQVRAGESEYVVMLTAVVRAADLLLTPAGGAS